MKILTLLVPKVARWLRKNGCPVSLSRVVYANVERPENVREGVVARAFGKSQIDFYLDGNDVSLERLVEIVCHELVHIAQAQSGRLAYKIKNTPKGAACFVYWNGVLMGENAEFSGGLFYTSSPWEEEAREYENKIAPYAGEILNSLVK